MYLSIRKVKPLENYKIELTFENNEVKVFNMENYLDTGIFKKLTDKNLFKQVRISFDTIEWPGGIDLDPEILYERSRAENEIIA
ncbi:MAG: DUF2442 domain-containing protein [Spirochaetaceae bacterium]|jgi:hypothetical protein|nr:DUF2442 domain-containing protein [Spirochaetaceae bacterium]